MPYGVGARLLGRELIPATHEHTEKACTGFSHNRSLRGLDCNNMTETQQEIPFNSAVEIINQAISVFSTFSLNFETSLARASLEQGYLPTNQESYP